MDQRSSGTGDPRRITPYAVMVVAAVLCGGIGINLLGSQSTEAREASSSNAEPRVVELLANDVAQARVEALQHTIPLTGSLQPLNQTEINSQQAGEIVEVMVREGDPVRRGQVLAKLDSTDLAARLQDKLGALEVGQAQHKLAQRNLAQNASLLKENFISQAAFDNFRSNHDVSEATLVSLRAQVQQARKALAEAVIRSPIDGVIAERSAQPGLAVADKTTLFAVQDLTTMNVEAPVPASEIPAIRVGQEAKLNIEGFADRSFVGTVDRINPSTESNSRSIIVHLRVANTDGQLRGGMFVEGTLGLAQPVSTIVVPSSAVHARNESSIVLQILDGTLVETPVETGQTDKVSGVVEIRSGLNAGDEVVLGSASNMNAGQTVRIAVQPAANQ